MTVFAIEFAGLRTTFANLYQTLYISTYGRQIDLSESSFPVRLAPESYLIQLPHLYSDPGRNDRHLNAIYLVQCRRIDHGQAQRTSHPSCLEMGEY